MVAGEATPTPSLSPIATTQETALPTPSDFLDVAARAPWRPDPLRPPTGFAPQADVLCRAAEPRIGEATRVLTDVRGEGRLVFVFADATAAFGCYAPIDANLAADVQAFPLDTPADPIAQGAIDIVLYEVAHGYDGAAFRVLMGRVGRDAVRVVSSFDDESEVEATKGGGWYAMWWLGPTEMATVAALDARSTVISAVPAPAP
jgi:hypothetical protein